MVCAGFPCPPISSAGLRKGLDDERWIWPDIAKIIEAVRPRFVFIENVPGLASWGRWSTAGVGGDAGCGDVDEADDDAVWQSTLGAVLGTLADLGFAAEWVRLSAAQFGAPHERKRLFILAYRDSGRGQGTRLPARRRTQGGRATLTDGSGPDVAHSDSGQGRPEARRDVLGRWSDDAQQVGVGGGDVAYTEGIGQREPYDPRRADTRTEPRPGAGWGSRDVVHADQRRGIVGTGQPHDPREGVQPADTDRLLADTEGDRRPAARRHNRLRSARRRALMANAKSPRRKGPRLQRHAACRGLLWPPGRDDVDGWRAVLAIDPSLEPALRRDADRLHAIGNGAVPIVAGYALVSLGRRAGLW